jgi:hypothetical protein
MDRIISFGLVLLLHLQILSSVGYARSTQNVMAVSMSYGIKTIQAAEKDNFVPKPARTVTVPNIIRTIPPSKIKPIPETPVLVTLPRSDADYATLLDHLPLQETLINSLQSDQLSINHKKSILYQALQKLPKAHQQALKVLILKEEMGETRGLGGQNTIVLTMGNMSDEELIGVFMHEMGHVVDTGLLQGKGRSMSAFQDGQKPVLEDDPSTVFYQYSWKSTTEKKENATPLDFVTGYAMTDPFEDFAESYLSYVLHGNTFRSILSTSAVLTQKYNFLKEQIFNGQEFNTGEPASDKIKRTFDATLLSFDLKQFLKNEPVIF